MLTESTKHKKKSVLTLRNLAVGIIFLVILGLLIDLFSGFYILRHSKSMYAGIIGLFLLAIFYLIGEAGGNWIGSKDDVSHPLYKRFFHLVIQLIYAGIIMTVAWFILNYFGIITI